MLTNNEAFDAMADRTLVPAAETWAGITAAEQGRRRKTCRTLHSQGEFPILSSNWVPVAVGESVAIR